MGDPITDWQSYLTIERGLKPNSRKLYSRVVEDVRDQVGDPTTLTTDDLRAWLRRRGGKAGTVGNRISALQSFYGFLVKARLRLDDPSAPLDRPRGPERQPDPVEDLSDVLAELDEVDRKANASGATSRRVGQSRDMAVFLAETGMRIGEAAACAWPTPCPSEITVIGRGHKELTVAVSDTAREAWNRLEGRWPCGVRATQRRFEKAGIHPHQLKHWHAVHIAGASPPQRPAPTTQPREGVGLRELSAKFSDKELETVVAYLTDLLEARRKSPARK